MERIIDRISGPSDLRRLKMADLPRIAQEIRDEILNTVSRTGGHLASSLGAIELAVALHYVFNTPKDTILWDVGHQAYAHKILTGRLKRFSTLRQAGGLSGFPNKDESPECDVFTTGHSSTSISTALGLVLGRDLKGEKNKIIAVIGDAALAGGMAFEGLNHAGHVKKDMIVILNDNELSISRSVGALSRYLNRIIANPAYNKIRMDVEKLVKRIPRFGFRAYRAARKLEEGLKNLLIPGMLFEEMGFRYFGPINGHDLNELVSTFRNLIGLNEPILIHAITKKGKGYAPAEKDPSAFHGTAPFKLETGETEAGPSTLRPCSGSMVSRAEPSTGSGLRAAARTFTPLEKQNGFNRQLSLTGFTQAFGDRMTELAQSDPKIIGITAAMIDGTGLNDFAAKFPERFFDVGIAEEHAVGLAAGLARNGFKPVVAIYSTFLQRGYDQVIHDVCLQNLPVVFCLDRSGLVGEDGPAHHGVFDIAYLRHVPNLVLMAPATPEELEKMLGFALRLGSPVAIRYPKGSIEALGLGVSPIELGKAEVIKKGRDLAILSLGSMLGTALETQDLLIKKGVDACIVNARFVKPIDEGLVAALLGDVKRIVTLEDGVLNGGFGSAVLEAAASADIKGAKVLRFGLPDKFIEHGKRIELFSKYDLTPAAICDEIIKEVMRNS
jgi:1-deoxy-D-xylulose-5-phosphate synthase